jgi:hypothetical protein
MIVFRNPGTLDIRALKTFGLSSKDESQIGRFGTGLKYATAVIMRHGGEVNIQSGGETYTIQREQDEFRGKEITALTINGEPLPFTADLGRDWEPWMAFRELYANALDEGGEVVRCEDTFDLADGYTAISVSMDAFEAIYFSMEEHFIGRDEEPICKTGSMEIYPGKSLFVFYRGIAVMKLKRPSSYRYNLLGYVDLTEDRTAKYDWIVRRRIAEALAILESEEIASVVTDSRNEFENSLDYSEHTGSEVFLGAAVKQGAACNATAMALVRAQLPDDTSSCTIVSREQPGGAALHDALQVLRATGADLSKVTFVLAEGVHFFGDYDVRNKAVFLNEDIFSKPDRMTLAVVEGYAEISGHHWLAKQLISRVEAAA